MTRKNWRSEQRSRKGKNRERRGKVVVEGIGKGKEKGGWIVGKTATKIDNRKMEEETERKSE